VVLLASGAAFASTYIAVPQGTQPGANNGPFNPPAPGAITYYNDEATFLANAGSVVNEDFLNSSAEPGGVCSGPSPLNSATNDACFSTGAVIDGFSVFGVPGDYVVLGTNFLGNPIPAVGPNTFVDDGEIQFDPPTFAVAFDLFAPLDPVNATIDIYGEGDVLLDSIVASGSVGGTFIGMVSTDLITRITTSDPSGAGELYGNLWFDGGGGDGGDGGGVPATSTWGVILLIALFMGVSLFYLRRRANA
jgi:hypothetical protein